MVHNFFLIKSRGINNISNEKLAEELQKTVIKKKLKKKSLFFI